MATIEVTLLKTHDLDVCTSIEMRRLSQRQWQARCSCGWEGQWWNMEDSAGFEGDDHLKRFDAGELLIRLPGDRFDWRCHCGCMNSAHEIFCYLCGDADPWGEE